MNKTERAQILSKETQMCSTGNWIEKDDILP